ncbi:hypothetical protein Angca_001860, partial [Angiostrongylus cantonensis]
LLVLLVSKLALVLCQNASIDCTFRYNLCGWQSEPPWLLTDRTFLPSPLNLSPITLIGDNAFMTAQGHFGSNSTADLISPEMPPSPILNILSFKYTKTIGDANLQIMMKDGSTYRNLDTIASNSLVFWIRRSLVVPPTLQPYQVIVFRASRLRTGFDVISIDDVMLRTASKQVISLDDDLYLTFEKWKLLNGKIVTESEPKAWLSSEPVLLPMNAHFQVDLFSTGPAIISIHQKFGSEELLMWTQSGLTLVGWNRVRLPIRFTPLPSRLLIKTSTRYGQLVAVTNTDIVDESGRDLACGGDVPVIRPQNDELIRLTALQKFESSQVESSSIPTLFVVSTSASTVSLLPSSLTYRPVPSSFSISSPGQVVPPSFATLPISPAQNFLATLKGQSVFDGQLKYLVKKLGLDRMSDEQGVVQRYGMIQRMLGALQHIKPPVIDQQPTSSVNSKDGRSDLLPEELSKFASSILPSSRAISGALNNKISQFIAPPRNYGDDSKPFSRNNMDFIIQNAYKAYVNQGKP